MFNKKKSVITQDSSWKIKCKEVFEGNALLMRSIVNNCPQNSFIILKLDCGNWTEDQLEAEIPALIREAKLHDGYCYLKGSGLSAVDPKRYHRDARLIMELIQSDGSRRDFCNGSKILWWRYVSL